MLKSSTIYLSVFSLFNILSLLYLNATVMRYKKQNTLSQWAKRSRLFLDNLDDTIKPYEVEEVDAAIKEIDKVFDFFKLKDFSPMPFLQIRADEDNKYDVRDDYEFGQATKNLSKKAYGPQNAEYNRKAEESSQPLNNINEQLFEAAKDDPTVSKLDDSPNAPKSRHQQMMEQINKSDIEKDLESVNK